MKRAVRSVLVMSALMSPAAGYALGLGEIRLNSALNEPFDAEIELVAATPEDLAALRASLASNDTFSRYGLDRPAYLSNFSFRVASAGGRDVLKVTSPGPVTEPFVTLLVEANWPRGHLLREYTVLLDPPLYAPAMPSAESAVAAPREVSSAPAPAVTGTVEPFAVAPPPPSPGSSPRPTAGRSSSASMPGVQPGSSYTVRRNDTLWKIASRANPGGASDVNRAMMAIYEANPQAFEGNINLLHAGAVLNIPEASEMSAIPASAAASEVARQYRQWRAGEAAVAGTADEGGQLRLVTPEQGAAAPSTATASPAAEEGPTPEDDLQMRVQQLEAELAEARRLLEVRNAELTTLQGAAPDEAAQEPVIEQPPELPVAEEPAAESEAAVESPVPPPPAARETVAPPVVEAPAPEEVKPGLLSRLADYWWLLLGLLAAVAGLVFFMRSRRESGEAESSLEEAMARNVPDDLRSRSPAASPAGGADILVEEAAGSSLEAPTIQRAPDTSRKVVPVEDTFAGAPPVGVGTSDPLAEADFHMAYGLYDQAADLIQGALKREPGRRDLKLKLLEIFFVWGNQDRFLEIAREMHGAVDEAQPGEWDKVVIMGKQIAPDDPLFAGTAARQSVGDGLDMELNASTSVLDMDFAMETDEVSASDDTGEIGAVSDEGALDFVLDDPELGAAALGSDEAVTIQAPGLPHEATVDESTAEVPIESLALDAGADFDSDDDVLEGFEDLEDSVSGLDDTAENVKLTDSEATEPTVERMLIDEPGDDTVENVVVVDSVTYEETVERPVVATADDTAEHEVLGAGDSSDSDMISVTSILKSDAVMEALKAAEEAELSEALEGTGEMPLIDTGRGAADGEEEDFHEEGMQASDFSLGEEAATMSEVGTKLDLARAYIDMGDPDGAKSILEEVLQEGNPGQREEAERLIGNLP
jgi:pilus assembly protein FimV